MRKRCFYSFACLLAVFCLTGCGTTGAGRKPADYESEISRLKKQMDVMKKEKDDEIASLQAQRQRDIERLQEKTGMQLTELEKAQNELTESLKNELGEYKAKLEMTERGLVITFLAEVFFSPGKDVVGEKGKESLKKVAAVLNADVPNSQIAVEGHTDSDPIKFSGWRSNWELSSARALAVLHFLEDDCGVSPKRLSANGYGEYHPVSPNDTSEGKRQNRRVEIIILPEKLAKERK